jgi:cobalt-zinc-cadmium efflux system protein
MANGHHHLKATSDIRSVLLALTLIAAFFLVEIVAAILGSSLVLFADAGHMITDVSALAISAWALRLAQRPAQARWTYGLQRAEILSAALNGVSLVAVALVIAVEAIQRLIDPHGVNGTLVLVIAIIGAGVNVAATTVLSRANRANLNIRGAYLHVLTDLYAFLATAIAGVVIVASLVVVALMARAAWGLLGEAGHILLQGTPDNLDLADVRTHLTRVSHVLEVHDLHAWSVSSTSTTLSAHVVVETSCFGDGHAPQILDALQTCLAEHFSVQHATFQLEPATHESHEGGNHP